MSREEKVEEMKKVGEEVKQQVDSYLTLLRSTTVDNLTTVSAIRAARAKATEE
jgi:hypothetical protein